MGPINPNSEVAMYKQLIQLILSQIEGGELKAGDKIPSESELVARYNISRVTVRAALKSLEEDEVLIRSQGKGTFVAAPRARYNADDQIGFTKSCLLAGRQPSTRLVKRELVYPSNSTRQFLGTQEDEKVIMTERLHSADGKPISIETNYYAKALDFILEEDLNGSLFELLEQKHHIAVQHSTRTLEVCLAIPNEAKLLGLRRGAPLLLFKDKVVDRKGAPLFYSKQIYCTETLEFYLY